MIFYTDFFIIDFFIQYGTFYKHFLYTDHKQKIGRNLNCNKYLLVKVMGCMC